MRVRHRGCRYDYIFSFTTLPIAGNMSLRLNDVNPVRSIKLMHKRMIRVRKDHIAPALIETCDHLCETYMILLIELLLRITLEIRIRRDRQIRRIQKDQIPRRRMMIQDIQIITADDVCTRKDARRRKNRCTITDFWIFIPPKGYIELPLLIDTVKPVKTSLVEEDHP